MGLTDAQRGKASALWFIRSQSLASRRHRLSQAMVRSTIQRLGRTTNLPASGSLDDLDIHPPADPAQPAPELRPLVTTVGVELQQEGKQPEHRRQQHHAAIAVLDIGGMGHGEHQQALRVDQDVALLALDLLARVKPGPVREPPFSALLTLWLSMIAAAGLASRPALSRHWT